MSIRHELLIWIIVLLALAFGFSHAALDGATDALVCVTVLTAFCFGMRVENIVRQLRDRAEPELDPEYQSWLDDYDPEFDE